MEILEEIRHSHLSGRGVAHQGGAPILEVSDLSVRYETGQVLEDVTFHLHTAERIAVVGPNGAGKSTLFKVIAGVLAPSEGTVKIFGYNPHGHICIAYLPQRSQVDWNFPVSVADVVMMGRSSKLGLLRWPKRRDWSFVHRCLQEVGLGELADRQISELSGGQQQRMFIARALAQEAELMLMDEPLSGLDVSSQEDIFTILDSLRHRQTTVMVATHDLEQAAERFDRVLLLNHKVLGLGSPEEVFTPERLTNAYGGRLRLVQSGESLLALTDSCCNEGE